MPYDPEVAAHALAEADPALGAVIARAGPCTLVPSGAEPYPALLRSIVYQQLSGKAAATIHGRLLALFGGEVPAPEALAGADEELLRSAGLSRAKALAVLDLARQAASGALPTPDEARTLPDDALIARLTQVRGVGPWTVEMYLMFGLGRPDVLPVTDLGVRAGYRLVYGGDDLPAPAALLAHGERWRPWRSVAAWYLWRAVDLVREAKAG